MASLQPTDHWVDTPCPKCTGAARVRYDPEPVDGFVYLCRECGRAWPEYRKDRPKCCTIRTVAEVHAYSLATGEEGVSIDELAAG
jgi:predicted RNA-binding Zn-ribbon protein involved in translation (DUF1610 family)